MCTYECIQKSSVADRVHFFRIRIRRSGFLNTDPELGDLKKTGSDQILIWIRILLRYVFIFSKINIFLWHFLMKFNHLMTLKIKDKKFGRNCILDNDI